MKTKIIGLFVLTVIITAFTISDDKGKIVKADEFQKYIDTIGLQFTMPPDYTETFVKENKDLWYSFAIKTSKRTLKFVILFGLLNRQLRSMKNANLTRIVQWLVQTLFTKVEFKQTF